jgi:hypothetical protein
MNDGTKAFFNLVRERGGEDPPKDLAEAVLQKLTCLPGNFSAAKSRQFRRSIASVQAFDAANEAWRAIAVPKRRKLSPINAGHADVQSATEFVPRAKPRTPHLFDQEQITIRYLPASQAAEEAQLDRYIRNEEKNAQTSPPNAAA